MTDVEAIAKQFWAWAREKGVLATQPPDDELEPLDLEDHATKAEAQAAEVILRHRKINFIGISDEENKIIAYTQKQISRGEKEDLPEFLDGKVSIEFRRGVLPTIRNANIGGGGVSVCDQYNGRYTCGSSVFVGNREGAGTFGCLVQNAQGQLLGLSNNHVTGGLSFADLKLPITAPAVLDVSAACPDPFTIGHHHSTLALIHGSPDNAAVSENFDAATFTIKDPARVTSM